MLALLMLLPVPQVLAAAATNRVEQAAFAYEAPAGWTVLKNEVRRDFAVLSFANAGGELIQLSVSGRLTAEQYAGAKTRLQAVDQQPMQRGLSELCTTPSGVFLIASAGHTRAQIGSSQCMQTCGAVWTVS
jgi:hypothetical protein